MDIAGNRKYFLVLAGGALIIIVFSMMNNWFGLKSFLPRSIYQQSSIQPASGYTKTNVASGMVLELTSPTDGQVTSTPSITVKGKTSPGAEVFVNEGETKADALGNFSYRLTLDGGENIISVSANDASGNYAEKEVAVTLNSN